MNKIIFILPHLFTKRDYHRFGAEYLEKKGYDVELWKVKHELSTSFDFYVSAGMYQGKNMFDIPLKQFDSYVGKNKYAFFIFFEYKSAKYMCAMAKYKCNYFLIQGTGAILMGTPERIEHKRDFKRFFILKNYINFFNFKAKKIYKKFIMTLAFKYFQCQLPRYVFSGVDITDEWLRYFPNSRKIYIHSYDYDRYLEVKDRSINNGEYIVYVDAGGGNLHHDQVFTDYYDPWYENRKNVFDKLNIMFDKLEEYYHIPIVIAGHPHTKYESDFLCNRKIVFDKTPELVANSKFVIMQFSTSISFVVLFKKNILVLIDDNFKKQEDWNNYYELNYKYFGITPCNMDIQEMARKPWKYVHAIDKEIVQNYIEGYIKMPGTPNKFFIEVIEEKIKEIIQNEVTEDANSYC